MASFRLVATAVAIFVVCNIILCQQLRSSLDILKEQQTSIESLFDNAFDPPTCDVLQLQKIQQQLPAENCIANQHRPWTSNCSFSAASSCPEARWLDHHFTHNTIINRGEEEEEPFLSFFVGCNKAIDAVNALRMGSRNPKYDVDMWKTVLSQGREGEFAGSSCAQFDKPYHDASSNSTHLPPRFAQVYCFEPVSSTFTQLHRTKLELGWANELILEEAAVSSKPGFMSVHKEVALGQENRGIDVLDCGQDNAGDKCRKIPIYTLNDYVGTMPKKPHIHFLSIDVEGYDFEVLKGASNILSEQVHYLEFEYNWKGPWSKQNLTGVIQMLHEAHGFICYWPGPKDGHVWRITGCWQDHYRFRYWANVACVNGRIPEARALAEDMEERFLRTIDQEGLVYERR